MSQSHVLHLPVAYQARRGCLQNGSGDHGLLPRRIHDLSIPGNETIKLRIVDVVVDGSTYWSAGIIAGKIS